MFGREMNHCTDNKLEKKTTSFRVQDVMPVTLARLTDVS